MTILQGIIVFFMGLQTYALFKNYNDRVTEEYYTPLYYGVATLVGIFSPFFGMFMLASLSSVLSLMLLFFGKPELKIFLISLFYICLTLLCL